MAGEIDTTQVIAQLLPALHADSVADLTFWSQADLVNWMDEACKSLAHRTTMLVERDTSTSTAAGTATYALPARNVTTLHVSLGTASLRPASQLELEARDSSYQSTAGTPDHWYEDRIGAETIGLCPVPTGEAPLAIVGSEYPPDLEQNTLVQAPAAVAGYLSFSVLARAYGREGESEMPDVAQHCAARAEFYTQIFQSYFGAGSWK